MLGVGRFCDTGGIHTACDWLVIMHEAPTRYKWSQLATAVRHLHCRCPGKLPGSRDGTGLGVGT